MNWMDWVAAARLALPTRCRPTGLTRIQLLGLDHGPRFPLRFVVEGDHHLALDRVFLHRTRLLAPTDATGIGAAGAFIAFCALARTIDAIKVGDWLLHHGHTSVAEIRDLALAARWRDGACEAVWILDHLDRRSRSLKESETRAVLCFAGMPKPEVNHPMYLEGATVLGDLVYPRWRTVVEYDGTHHQRDREQYNSDIDRYATLRATEFAYVQVTREKLARPRRVVGEVFATITERGYDGPMPSFGTRWHELFAPLRQVLGNRNDYLRELARAG